jgi:hypothetical protein
MEGLLLETNSRKLALDAYYRFFETFNARDSEAWANALAFPHVRVSHRGPVEIVPTADAHVAATSWDRIESTGWDHTTSLEPRIVHEGTDRFHIAGGWTRYTRDQQPILSSLVTYVITRLTSTWGIQARFGVDPARDAAVESDTGPAKSVALAYLEDWNEKRFMEAAGRLNYPYVRVNPGEVVAWHSPSEHLTWLESQPWRAIQAPDVRVVQAGPSAVNLALQLTDGAVARNCLLLVTSRNGRWGIQAESTY